MLLQLPLLLTSHRHAGAQRHKHDEQSHHRRLDDHGREASRCGCRHCSCGAWSQFSMVSRDPPEVGSGGGTRKPGGSAGRVVHRGWTGLCGLLLVQHMCCAAGSVAQGGCLPSRSVMRGDPTSASCRNEQGGPSCKNDAEVAGKSSSSNSSSNVRADQKLQLVLLWCQPRHLLLAAFALLAGDQHPTQAQHLHSPS